MVHLNIENKTYNYFFLGLGYSRNDKVTSPRLFDCISSVFCIFYIGLGLVLMNGFGWVRVG